MLCSQNQEIQVSSIPDQETENIQNLHRFTNLPKMSRIVNNSKKPSYGTLHHVINFVEVIRIPNIVLNGMKNISFNANRSLRQPLANNMIYFNTKVLQILDRQVIALEVNVFESVAFLLNWTPKEIKGFNNDDIIWMTFPLELEQRA